MTKVRQQAAMLIAMMAASSAFGSPRINAVDAMDPGNALAGKRMIAFPGAEGYGRFAQGGRGGDVYHVLNLKDNGPGSLREGLESCRGPRTIVFDVSGTIRLEKALTLESNRVTIAGQTAPGDGITLRDHTFKIKNCSDIIVRYLRVRLGDESKTSSDTIGIEHARDVILDHVTATWGVDGTMDTEYLSNFTLQWSIYGEALHEATHHKGAHAMLMSLRKTSGNVSLHHNLFFSSRNRHPSLGGGSLEQCNPKAIVDFRNNVLYNWSGSTNLGIGQFNLISNYYRPGPNTDTGAGRYPVRPKVKTDGVTVGYMQGTVFEGNEAWSRNNHLAMQWGVRDEGYPGNVPQEAFCLPAQAVAVMDRPLTHAAEKAYELVLAGAGAALARDAADKRIVQGIQDRTHCMIDSQNDVGGWPALHSKPAPRDTDQDGMPDAWEKRHGLDPKDPADRNGDADGYTNLEAYLNSLVPDMGMTLRNSRTPYQANGVKVGEVTQTSAIVWTRLTRIPERRNHGYVLNRDDEFSMHNAPKDAVPPEKYPVDVDLETMHGATPGAPGEVRLTYQVEGSHELPVRTAWIPVDKASDCTHKFTVTGLMPRTDYVYTVECRAAEQGPVGPSLDGHFRTAPEAGDPAPILFTVVTGHKYQNRDREDGHQIFHVMRDMKPDFFIHTGDIVYMNDKWVEGGGLDGGAVARARLQWNRINGLRPQIDFYRTVPTYMMKDDHDIGPNDSHPNRDIPGFSFRKGIAVFNEQQPTGDRGYRTVRWGRDLQIWLVEGRDYRSPNNMPDGPGKTIWGAEQFAWLKQTVRASDAAFKVLISPTPLVGPDRVSKGDNHANKNFAHEGRAVRQWIHDEAPELLVVCGDRHWQYVSVHPQTGVREYSCGSTTDKHAGGWKHGFIEAYHRYLNVIGGFLSVTVERIEGKPNIVFRHHDVEGRIRYVDRHIRD